MQTTVGINASVYAHKANGKGKSVDANMLSLFLKQVPMLCLSLTESHFDIIQNKLQLLALPTHRPGSQLILN
jgi:hypothetical protein